MRASTLLAILGLLRSRGGDWTPEFLLRDDFTTDDAAPLTSPRTAEPGPGTLTAVQTDGQLSVSGGKLAFPAQTTPAFGDQGFYDATARSRLAGRALLYGINGSTVTLAERAYIGWGVSAAVHSVDGGHSVGFNPNATGGLNVSLSSTVVLLVGTFVASTDYQVAVIQRGSGAIYLIKGGLFTSWTLLWVENAGSTTPLYATFSNHSFAGALDFFHALDLPAPFDTDYGLATQRIAGSVSASQAFVHEADCLIEYGWTGATDFNGSKHVTVSFRSQDASNLWKVRLQGNNVVALFERVAGVDTSRGSASSIPNGRVVIVASGITIRVYVANVLRITYASASNFADRTNGSVIAVDADGTCSNLTTWPRTLTGQAAAILDQAVAA